MDSRVSGTQGPGSRASGRSGGGFNDLMDVPDLANPLNSYLAIDNMKKGLDPEENKNTKVTLELL